MGARAGRARRDSGVWQPFGRRPKSLRELKPGKKSGTVQVVFEWAAPGQGALLEEQDRTMTFYAAPRGAHLRRGLDLYGQSAIEVCRPPAATLSK
jgi:hypothetical protein